MLNNMDGYSRIADEIHLKLDEAFIPRTLGGEVLSLERRSAALEFRQRYAYPSATLVSTYPLEHRPDAIYYTDFKYDDDK